MSGVCKACAAKGINWDSPRDDGSCFECGATIDRLDDIRLHCAVRDRATQGVDFLMWDYQCIGETTAAILDRAMVTFMDALRDGLDVELIITKRDV
jgi:hypothetical protein